MDKTYYVYILAGRPHGYLYVGVTNNLVRRMHEHREQLTEGHTKQNTIKSLVHFENYQDSLTAIAREKQLKRYPRQHKFILIESQNPHWQDLWPKINQ